jgi:hypothetical protein
VTLRPEPEPEPERYSPDRSLTHQASDIADTATSLPTDIADTSSEGAQTVTGMPWKATDAMKERTKFVLEWERRWNEAEGGPVNMAELCRMYGIRRQTGYKLVNRCRQANHSLEAVAERSRRPTTAPDTLPVEVEDSIVAARKKWPTWGPT